MKPKASLVVLVSTLWAMTTLMGCAPPTAKSPGSTPNPGPAVELATTTPLPPYRIAATSFIDAVCSIT
jgi:hypothetical protein